jgi:alpha/beta superfamily hydrolase
MNIHNGETNSIRHLDDGSTEEAGWLDVDGERLYQVTRTPAGVVRALVTMCPAIGGEFDGGYRRQTILARLLLTHGVATRRIHYRGAGNSQLSTDTIRSTMVADATAAAADLAARYPRTSQIVLGERVGALVAAEVAIAVSADHLLLWHPVTDVTVYLRELGRAAKLQTVATSRDEGGAEFAATFRADYEAGLGDLVGFSVMRKQLESFEGHPIVDSTPHAGCSVDLFQFGRKTLDPKYAKLLRAWDTETASTRSHLVDEAETWWFAPGPWKRGEEQRPVTRAVIDATLPIIEQLASTPAEARS